MRQILALGVITVRAQSNRCDDTVQDNCIVNDNQSADCKAFLASRDPAQGWTAVVWDDAAPFCREQGGRLMKVSNFYDLSKLGTDPASAFYSGAAVMVTERDASGAATGNFVSYDEPVDSNMWVSDEPSGGEPCAQLVGLPNAKVPPDQPPNPNVHYLLNDVDCGTHERGFVCEKHVERRDTKDFKM